MTLSHTHDHTICRGPQGQSSASVSRSYSMSLRSWKAFRENTILTTVTYVWPWPRSKVMSKINGLMVCICASINVILCNVDQKWPFKWKYSFDPCDLQWPWINLMTTEYVEGLKVNQVHEFQGHTRWPWGVEKLFVKIQFWPLWPLCDLDRGQRSSNI